jgi:hypothetical protein
MVPTIVVIATCALVSCLTPSVHVASMIVALFALIAVFVSIPFISDYAYWFMLAAYIMMNAHHAHRK